MTASIVLTSIDQQGVATVTLNRPEVHNAYNGALIDALIAAVEALAGEPRVRLLVLRASGKHFQAGADLAWLQEVAGLPLADNVAFSRRTTLAMRALNAFPRPTLALVHGACFGGGVGMVASCDVAIATESASFALTEVRWGVIPAPIVPQLCAALGVRHLRRYGVTGERFDASEARRIGLVHEVCPDDALDRTAAPIIDAILKGAPDAVRDSKRLVLAQAGLDLTEQQVEALAVQAAVKRASAEAADGLASFLDKRDPPGTRRLERGDGRLKLEGIKVVDLSLFLPGPAMTQVMADHGAEVIKVEPLPEGEPNRAIGLERNGVSVWFANTHRGKKSLTLNLKTAEGVEALLRLAATADVLLEAFRPGVVDRLGIGYRAVAARNPRIVYASISAYGQSGPYARKPAHDLAVQAMSGVLSVNLGRDNRPWNPALQAADMLACHIALTGVLMALLRRERTGRGDYMDVAMMDALIASMPNNYGPPLAEKRDPVAKDERSWGGNAMYRLYETRDGRFVALGGSETKFARNLLAALGRPDLIELCRLPPGPGQAPVRAFLAETFRTRTQAEWVEWMADKDVAFAPVKTLREGLDDPQVRHRAMVVEDERGWEHLGMPIKFQDEPGAPDFRLPAPGEHSEDILSGLGYSGAELAEMKAQGVY